MKVELPEFKRCCCFIPLRYGLLAWGYLKLIITLLVLIFITYALTVYIRLMVIYRLDMVLPEIILGIVFDVIILLDIALTIVFLIGGHRKTPKLLRVYYIYSVVFICISTLLFLSSTAFELYFTGHYASSMPNGFVSFSLLAQTKLITGLTNIGLQVYVTLLIRSEINKLNNNSKFRFSNIATEAKCAMENGTTVPEIGTNDHTNVTNEHENETRDDINNSVDQTKVIQCETYNYKKF